MAESTEAYGNMDSREFYYETGLWDNIYNNVSPINEEGTSPEHTRHGGFDHYEEVFPRD